MRFRIGWWKAWAQKYFFQMGTFVWNSFKRRNDFPMRYHKAYVLRNLQQCSKFNARTWQGMEHVSKRPKLGGIIKSDLLITVFFLIFVLDEDKMVTDSLCSGRFSLPEYSYTDAFFCPWVRWVHVISVNLLLTYRCVCLKHRLGNPSQEVTVLSFFGHNAFGFMVNRSLNPDTSPSCIIKLFLVLW